MFTVKATYRSETRKLSFNSPFFPSYNDLCRELYRVFPISQNYYLSKLLFSPDSSSNARILIAKEVHSSDDYLASLMALPVRAYPSPLLKFTVFDENPHKTPSSSTTPGEAHAPRIAPTPIGARVSYPSHSDHRLSVAMSGLTSGTLTNPNVSFQTSLPTISFSHIPPPPIIFSSCHGVDTDMNSPTATNSTLGFDEPSFPPSRESTARPPSCCVVSQAKAEIQSLMASFKSDIDRIMNNAFGLPASAFDTPVLPMSQCFLHPQPQFCTTCLSRLGSSWYICLASACPFKLCDSCYSTHASAHSRNAGPSHFLQKASCNFCPATIRVGNLPPGFVPQGSVQTLGAYESFPRLAAWPLPPGMSNPPPVIPPFVPPVVLPGLQEPVNGSFGPPRPNAAHAIGGNTGPYSELVQSPIPIQAPIIPQVSPSATPASVQTRPITPPTAATVNAGPVHPGIICDECDKTIVGVRHKCLDCSDFDLCAPCMKNGSAERHNPFHEFFDIDEPRRTPSILSADGERVAEATAPTPIDIHNTSENARVNPVRTDMHNATCNLCDSRIVGLRYKCTDCPDFDTCASCFRITLEQHPGHSFVKLSSSDDLISRRTRRNTAMHYATCDGCHKQIRDIRYKCLHLDCPDFDLCADCEAHPIPVHPVTHPFVKLRFPDTIIPTLRAAPPATAESVITRGRSTTRSVSRGPFAPDAFRRFHFSDSSSRVEPPTAALLAESAVRAAPSPPYVPPHLVGYSDRWLDTTSTRGTATPSISRSSRSRSRSRSSMPSPIYDLCPSHLMDDSVPPRESMRGRSPSPVCHKPGRHYASRSASEVYHGGPLLSDDDSVSSRSASRQRSTIGLIPPQVPAAPGSPRGGLNCEDQPCNNLRYEIDSPKTPLVCLGEAVSVRGRSASVESMSPRSQAPFKLPPLYLDPSADLFCEFWPRVTQEFRHLLQERSVDTAREVRDVASTVDGQATPQIDTAAASISNTSLPLSTRSSGISLPSRPTSLIGNKDDEPLIQNQIIAEKPTSQGLLPETMSTELIVEPIVVGPVTDSHSSSPSTKTKPALSAMFLQDNTVSDGQPFPPGAEFMKCWRMRNDGVLDWPEATEIVFAAGDSLALDDSEPQRIKVGSVASGSEVNVWTGELKAPDVPGTYVGFWRLSDGKGNFFGHSVWIEINVAAPSAKDANSAEGSLASSSIIMPTSANGPIGRVATESILGTVTSSATVRTESAEDSDSVSLISIPSSNEDDESVWEDSRSHVLVSPPVEYVVLYDSSSDEE